jgi:hypothetical protein
MYTQTENSANQYASSGTACLDLFSRIGGMRNTSPEAVLLEYAVAYREDPELATRILFWARAAREGAGERRVFHAVLSNLAELSPDFVADNAKVIAELGYFKDLVPYFHIDGVAAFYASAVKEKDRLACKWAPRKGDAAKLLKQAIGFTWAEYRKWLKEHSETVEQAMAAKQFDDIAYSHVPGQALRKYRKAFDRHDGERFEAWKNDKSQTAAVSASYPHDVYKVVMQDAALGQKQWDNLPNFLEEGEERILSMCDVSGSMNTGNDPSPMDVSVALGLYLAERAPGQFKNSLMTFSANPTLIRLDENMSLLDKFMKIRSAPWGMNTDFAKAYGLILDTAKTFGLAQAQMPTMLLVLSDMQFDRSYASSWGEKVEKPHLEEIAHLFEEAGYKMPKLVFWNLRASAGRGAPAQASDPNVAMVSGFSPVLMKAILSGVDFTPVGVMMQALEPIKVVSDNLPQAPPELDSSGHDRDGVDHYQPRKPHNLM